MGTLLFALFTGDPSTSYPRDPFPHHLPRRRIATTPALDFGAIESENTRTRIKLETPDYRSRSRQKTSARESQAGAQGDFGFSWHVGECRRRV